MCHECHISIPPTHPCTLSVTAGARERTGGVVEAASARREEHQESDSSAPSKEQQMFSAQPHLAV